MADDLTNPSLFERANNTLSPSDSPALVGKYLSIVRD
jgi:hypothetical protein